MKNIVTVFLCFLFLTAVFISCDKKAGTSVQKEEKQNIAKVTDTTTIDGVLLELIDNNGKAELKVHSDKYVLTGQLKITPPCYFIREGNEVQDFSFPKVGVQHTLGIVGNILKEEEKKYTGIAGDEICGMRMQGILIKKDSIVLTYKIIMGGMNCRGYGLSEQNFSEFAHSRRGK